MTSIPDSTLIDENGKPPNDLESAKFSKEKETVDVIQPTAKLIGLTKEQLEQYRNDPFWKTVRYALFIAFWLVWLAMFVGAILIVVMSPKCVDVKWPDKMVAYKLFSLGFKDSDSGNDGNAKFGDFVGIKEKLAEIKDMGVSVIWPTPILNVDKNDHSPDAVVKLEIDNDLALGGLAKFKDLIKSAHAKDIKVIVDLPLTVASGNAANWAKGIQDAVKESQGPVSALNLKNQKVEESLIGLAREYIEWGIDGINLANYGLGDGDLSGLIQKIRQIAGAEHLPIYSDAAIPIPTNGDTYRTESLIGNERVKNVKELVGKLHAKIDEIIKQRKERKKEENATTLTSSTVFNLGNLNRGGHRVDELLNDANLTLTQKEKIAFLFTLVQLSIPGPISVLYGEELALLSGKAKEERNKTNLVEYPWTWDNSTNKGNNEFLLDPQNAASNNYEDQNKQENSALKIFSKVAKMHQQNDFILGDFTRISFGNLDAYLVKRGTDSASNYYGLIVNWNGNEQELDGAALTSRINDANAKKLSIVAATDANLGDSIDFGKEGGSKTKIPAFGAVAFHTAE